MQLLFEPFPEVREVLDNVHDAVMEQHTEEPTELAYIADIERLLTA
jgi:hypothetical protein